MKKIIIPVIFILLLGIAFLLWINRTVSTVTLDINPSIEINLKANGKVKNVKALNEDAKKIITNDLSGKTLDEIIDSISEKAVENGYISNENNSIIIYGTGNVNIDNIKVSVQDSFYKRNIPTNVIIIEEVTKEDITLAKKYNITPAKAAYISEMISENENLTVQDLANKPVDELKETKESGFYCEAGYNLEGNTCAKAIKSSKPEIGDVCPTGYYEYEGKCYADVGIIESDELVCNGDLKLNDEGVCIGVMQIPAIPNFTCSVGSLIKRSEISVRDIREAGDADEYLCEDRSNASYPTERCYLQEHAIINGKCAMGPKPLLPTPTGCEGHDINYNGGCYDPAPSEPYVCPNGERRDDASELCQDTFKYTKASGNYSCYTGYTLNGTKCEKEVTEPPHHKPICKDGYTLVDNGRCIDKTKVTEHIDGNVCTSENERLEDGMCVTYEYIEAMHN